MCASSLEGRRYETIANEIGRALRFMRAIGIDLGDERSIHEVDVWTSHEALLLDYEEPLVRKDSTTGDWYACSGHFLWVGERTRQIMERIDALPPHEMFTLAGELLTSGAEIRLAIAVANRAIDKLRVLAEAR